MQNYINTNGTFILADTPVVTVNNRSFRYGDALFETIRIANHRPQFLKEHLQRLFKGMKVLKMEMNPLFNESFVEYAILELAKKNNITSDGRVRFTVYRCEGGLYAPNDNKVSFVLEAYPIEEQGFFLNTKGYTVDLFLELKKTPNALSSIKSANSAIYVMAGIHKTQEQLDDCLLLNDKQFVIEAISSNIFVVKNGMLYTPPIDDGCVDGVMRRQIIEIAKENKMTVYENSIMQDALLGADEFFLTNTINGIRWVVAYKHKRYFNSTSKKLTEKLNNLVGN